MSDVKITPDLLKDLKDKAAKATDGTWTVYDMAEEEQGDWHWWWVWREENLPYYGGILDTRERQLSPNTREELNYYFHGIGSAEVTDTDDSGRERSDAEYIAAAQPKVVSALVDLLLDYEHRISWSTTCKQCADDLDKSYALYSYGEHVAEILQTLVTLKDEPGDSQAESEAWDMARQILAYGRDHHHKAPYPDPENHEF